MQIVRCAFAAAAALSAVAASTVPTCPTADAGKYDCYPWDVANATVCTAHGCCWSPSSSPGVPWCFYPSLPAPTPAVCAAVTLPSRVDCHPEPNADATSCAARGCCWSPTAGSSGVAGIAACFFPHTDGYVVTSTTPVVAGGFNATLALGSSWGPYRNDVVNVSLAAAYVSQQTLRLTLSDPGNARWVPPVPLQPLPATPP